MSVAIITGSSGLVGSECVRTFAAMGFTTVGVDNDMRGRLFGPDASTRPSMTGLQQEVRDFHPVEADIRDAQAVDRIFSHHGPSIGLVIHAAAQPSHHWAALDPAVDFGINATGTLNVLEASRRHCPGAVFILTSTNKVYGDTPNRLPLLEQETRWELDPAHPYFTHGVNEQMSLDQSRHSLMGASKLAADILAQEYAQEYGMPVGIFRCGCLTGPQHAGTEYHGFLAYLAKCALTGRSYRIYGYRGKQVRDNLHAADLVAAFVAFHRDPEPGGVFNMGGGRRSHCSLREAIALCEQRTGRVLHTEYDDTPRAGDHLWWVSDTRKFEARYPGWQPRRNIGLILDEILGCDPNQQTS